MFYDNSGCEFEGFYFENSSISLVDDLCNDLKMFFNVNQSISEYDSEYGSKTF